MWMWMQIRYFSLLEIKSAKSKLQKSKFNYLSATARLLFIQYFHTKEGNEANLGYSRASCPRLFEDKLYTFSGIFSLFCFLVLFCLTFYFYSLLNLSPKITRHLTFRCGITFYKHASFEIKWHNWCWLELAVIGNFLMYKTWFIR